MPDRMNVGTRALPGNFGPLRGANGNARITGPCGDTMEFWVHVQDGVVLQASYTTDGCGHSIACGSVAAGLAEGLTMDAASRIGQRDVILVVGDLPPESAHCALLAANTLQAALRNAASGRKVDCSKAQDEDPPDAAMEGGHAPDSGPSPRERLARIRHKVLVLSGKGGVGKSTVAVNLALALAGAGMRTGLLDVDLHGPSAPKMLGMKDTVLSSSGGLILPAEARGLKVVSMGFLLHGPDEALIWRGPRKMGMIRQFVEEVDWGDLDFLVVDTPPGTGDEPLSVCQALPDADGALIVTTPQEAAVATARKSAALCRALSLPVLGVVENMSGLRCPACGKMVEPFSTGGGERMASELGAPFLGRLPLEPDVGQAGDRGASTQAVDDLFRPLADAMLALASRKQDTHDFPPQ